MDIFDFIPIVPPGMPGDSRDQAPGQELASGVGAVVLPGVNFLVVLFAGFAHNGTVALILMPVVSAVALFVLARFQSVGVAWAIVYAMCCAAFCFVANGCALFIVGLVGFFHTF
jgi:hypothetical protein